MNTEYATMSARVHAFVIRLWRRLMRRPEPKSVFRVTDGEKCFSCESYYDHFLLRPEDGGKPWTTVELSNHGLRKC
jgi:hypothetical protein